MISIVKPMIVLALAATAYATVATPTIDVDSTDALCAPGFDVRHRLNSGFIDSGDGTFDDETFATSIVSNVETQAPWLGVAPWSFDSDSVTASETGVSLPAKYRNSSFEFPKDDSCGCEFFDYTTAIVASKDKHGYGFYETKLTSVATGFVNSFWMQGDVSEINIARIDADGAMSASYYCYSDPAAVEQQMFELPGSFESGDTFGLFYTADKLSFAHNGVAVASIATPECLKGAAMNVIWSVEGGAEDSLPDPSGMESGTEFGALGVEYISSFDVLDAAPVRIRGRSRRQSVCDTAAPTPSPTAAVTPAATEDPTPSPTAAVVEDNCAGLKQWKCKQNKACSYDFAAKSCALAVVASPTPSPTAAVVEDNCAGLKQWKCKQNKACSYDDDSDSCAPAPADDIWPR